MGWYQVYKCVERERSLYDPLEPVEEGSKCKYLEFSYDDPDEGTEVECETRTNYDDWLQYCPMHKGDELYSKYWALKREIY